MPFRPLSVLLITGLAATTAIAGPPTRPVTQPATRPAERRLTAKVLATPLARGLPAGFAGEVYARNFARQPYNPESVQVLLMVANPGGTIVEADQKRLRIDTFLDDSGRDLRRTPGLQLRDTFYNTGGNLSADRKAALLVVMTDKEPAPDAERILFRGTAVVTTAAGERKSAAVPLALRVGGTARLGGATLTVTKLGLIRAGEGGLQVEAESDRPLDTADPIADLAATDAGGKDMGLRMYGRASDRLPGAPIKLAFTLDERAAEARLIFTHSVSAEEQTFPFEVEIDLGTAQVGPPLTPDPATRPATNPTHQ